MKKHLLLAALLSIPFVLQAGGQEKAGHGDDNHVLVKPDDLKWGPAPPGLPSSVKVALVAGHPGKAIPFVVRVKLPDGTKIAPHWHPTDEHVTVLKGTLLAGKGEKFDASTAMELPAGGFALMPKELRHFVQAKGETILQVHGIGPFTINYVNPQDDPRNQGESK